MLLFSLNLTCLDDIMLPRLYPSQAAAREKIGGSVFTWGRGLEGQLGLNSTRNIRVPQLVTTLRDIPIVQVRAKRYIRL